MRMIQILSEGVAKVRIAKLAYCSIVSLWASQNGHKLQSWKIARKYLYSKLGKVARYAN